MSPVRSLARALGASPEDLGEATSYGMNKYIIVLILSVGFFSSLFLYGQAQGTSTLTATLNSNTPTAKSISAGAQNVDVARITLTASGGDVFLNGIYLATDVSGGLSNFTNIFIYDTYDDSLVGVYPNQSVNSNLVQFSNVTIGLGLSKTYLVRVTLSSSAAGNVRVGFSGFTFSTQATPVLSGVPIYGNVMTLPGSTPTPTPTPVCEHAAPPQGCSWQGEDVYPTCGAVLVCTTPTPTPTARPTPSSLGFTSLAALNLSEGNTISATGLPAQAGSTDPDIYIANRWGYKRLFLNPIIFSFYGHLGGFANVKNISSSTRDVMVTSGIFRNCETNDTKVYGLEVVGEDGGMLHWINTSGEQAIADDPEFFKKVFCINNNEFNWYQKGTDYTSVNQVSSYSR